MSEFTDLAASAAKLTPDDFASITPYFWNDAETFGVEHPAMEVLLDTPVTLMTGDCYGQHDRRNTQDGKWTVATLTWRQWIEGGPAAGRNPAWGFSRHPVAAHKEGACFVLGEGIDHSRKAKAMKTVSALGLDIDSGAPLNTVLDKIADLKLFALVYTSFNHGRSGLQVKRDEVLRKLRIKTDPTIEQVREYLRIHSKARYEESFLDSLSILSAKKQVKAGVVIDLDSTPLEKYRIVLPLAKSITIIDLAESHDEALKVFEDTVTGLAQNLLGIHLDSSCTDPSRLFFSGRHSKDSADWYAAVIKGRPLTFEEIKPMSKAVYIAGRKGQNPFEIAGGDVSKEVATADGLNLKQWAAKYASRLEIARLIEVEAPDRVRQDKGGLHVVECPFEVEHSTEGGSGCHVRDADGDVGFTWKCKHDSCGGHDRLDMLREAIDLGWFDASAITDDDYLVPLPDEDLPDNLDAERFEPVKDWLPDRYKVKAGTIYLTGSGDEDPDRPLCQFFNVLGRGSNVVGDDGASRIIVFENLNGVEVEIELNRADLYGDGAKGVIDCLAAAEMGLFVRDSRGKGLLLDLLTQITPKRRIPTSPRPGWTKDPAGRVLGFMCPTGEYIAVDPAQPMRLHTDATIQHKQKYGTLEGWKVAASAAINVTENFYWGVGVAAGFVGPVMGLIGGEPCGMFLSGATSKGKSEALRLAVSAWATPHEKRGLFFTLNTTANAIEDLATLGSGTVAAFDEVGAMQNLRDLPAILFGLATGAGKSRKRGRGAGLDDGAEFQPFILLTNERPLKASVEGAGGTYKDGLSVRFPTIDVTGGVKVAPATMNEIAGCAANFGHAGPAFVRHLIAQGYYSNPDALRARHAELVTRIVGEGADAPMKRAGRAFGLVALAGEIAKEAGLIDGDVLPAVVAAFETFKGADEGRNVSGDDGILSAFRSWLVGEMGVSVVPANEATERRYKPVVGWHTASHFILDWEKLRDLDRLGINGTRSALVQALKAIGAIEMSGKNNFHNALPTEVEFEESTGSGRLANLRILRDKLGL